MARFMVWYSTTEYGKAFFTANNIEHAYELLDQIDSGELLPEELPEYNYKIKGGDGWDYQGLEELD